MLWGPIRVASLSLYHSFWKNSNKTFICIAVVKALFSVQNYCHFSYFSTKTYVVGTHNICFHGEIRKILT